MGGGSGNTLNSTAQAKGEGASPGQVQDVTTIGPSISAVGIMKSQTSDPFLKGFQCFTIIVDATGQLWHLGCAMQGLRFS